MSEPWICAPRPNRRSYATSAARGCEPTCRGSTARGCRLTSTIWPKRSRSSASWQRELADAGWVGVTWPVEYGGRAAGPLDHYVVQEELARARAPELVGRIGINLVGPTLLAHGTDEQKQRWLADILRRRSALVPAVQRARGRQRPRLAATRVPTKVDGGWHVNGQKVWTSYAQFADWGLLLARTDPDAPKHKGITALAIDMHQPGVDVRPLRQITDETDFNEVFFTDAFVPDDQVVGELNDGWRVSSSTLTHERGTNPRQLVIHAQLLEELLRLAIEQERYDDHRLQQRLAEAYVEVRLFQLHNWRSLSRLAERSRARPGGQRAEAVLERDEQAAARHGHGRAGRSVPALVGSRRTTPATAAGSAAGSTTNPRRSSPARTRSSARSSASGCWDCRGSHDE